MNQPIEQRFKKIEERLDRIEQDHGGIVENEKLLLKMAKYHRAGLQELKGKAEQIELTQGDINERLDYIERSLERHGRHLESIEQTQGTHTEVLGKLVDLSESHTKHFDRIEAAQDEHNRRLDRIETTMVTKEDMGKLKEDMGKLEARMGQMESAQTEQGQKLDLILTLLQPRLE